MLVLTQCEPGSENCRKEYCFILICHFGVPNTILRYPLFIQPIPGIEKEEILESVREQNYRQQIVRTDDPFDPNERLESVQITTPIALRL